MKEKKQQIKIIIYKQIYNKNISSIKHASLFHLIHSANKAAV